MELGTVEFWTSVEGGSFLKSIIQRLIVAGVDARHRFIVSERSYRGAKGRLTRLCLRSRMYVEYPARLGVEVLHRHRVHRVVSTNTFYAPWIASRFKRRNESKVIHLVYDLFPDVLIQAGMLRKNSSIERVCWKFVNAALKNSDANVFLGKNLLHHAEERFGSIPNAWIIPVGADGSMFRDSPPLLQDGSKTTLKVLYCGNMGRLHEIETLIDLAKGGINPAPTEVEFEFFASGVGFSELKTKVRALQPVPGLRFHFGSFLEGSEWRKRMLEADVALVTMSLGAEKLAMPSKTYSALVAGQAVLAICSPKSDLADLVRQHKCGWVVAPGDISSLKRVLEEIQNDQSALLKKRQNAFHAGHTHFDESRACRLWLEMFDAIGMKPRAGQVKLGTDAGVLMRT